MKTILKIVIAIILILNVLVLTSCRSGWSCKKRYAETSNEVKTKNNGTYKQV